MTLRPSFAWVLSALLIALVVMTFAANAGEKLISALAAGAFAIILLASALITNAPFWTQACRADNARISERGALQLNARLMMLAFLWCALAFYAIYLATSVSWQHGWEYGSAALLIALGIGYHVRRLSEPDGPFSTPAALKTSANLVLLQAAAIAVGLAWLIASGKVWSQKGDWPANQLFLSGGLTVIGLGLIIAKTAAVLRE